MKPAILFILALVAVSCFERDKPQTTESLTEQMDRIERYWSRDKLILSPYRYMVGLQEGASYDGTITVAEDKVVARSYASRSSFGDESYVESGGEVGSHNYGLPIRLVEDFFPSCRELIAKAEKPNYFTLVYKSIGYFSCKDNSLGGRTVLQFRICPESLTKDNPEDEDCPKPEGI